MRYEVFLGTNEVLYSGEVQELCDSLCDFMTIIENNDNSTGTFEIINEEVNGFPLYFATVSFPSWAEALFLVKFFDYSWELLEES